MGKIQPRTEERRRQKERQHLLWCSDALTKGESREEASATMVGSEEQMASSNPKVNEEGKASVCVEGVTRQMSSHHCTHHSPPFE